MRGGAVPVSAAKALIRLERESSLTRNYPGAPEKTLSSVPARVPFANTAESSKPMWVAVRSREGRGRGEAPPPRPVPYCFLGIPAENAGTMFFMSPGSPVGWRTTMTMLHLPKGDSDREDSYEPFPCPSDRNV